MKPVQSNSTTPQLVDIHTPETFKEKLKKFGAGAMGLSIIVHTVLLLLAIFVFVKWVAPKKEAPPDFSGVGGGGGGTSESAHKVSASARKATMSSDKSRRVAVEGTTDIALPDPSESVTDAAAVTMQENAGVGGGSGGGQGTGTGTGIGRGKGPGSGDGTGTGLKAGFPTKLFFGQEMLDRRTVFVLDYSKSMEEQNRKDLLQSELEKSLGSLNDNVQYQVVLFAGYAWVPGDKVDLAADQMSATITSPEAKDFQWLRPSRSNFDWIAVEGSNKHFVRGIPWLTANQDAVAKTMSDIKSYKLQMNTSWEIPLEMALAMQPAPEVIYFMTDGITGDSDAKRIVDRIVKKAGTKTHINTISMMEPKETEAMQELAKKTSGGFSIVNADKTAKVVFPEKNLPAVGKGGPGSDLR